jgi:hypothetical protein
LLGARGLQWIAWGGGSGAGGHQPPRWIHRCPRAFKILGLALRRFTRGACTLTVESSQAVPCRRSCGIARSDHRRRAWGWQSRLPAQAHARRHEASIYNAHDKWWEGTFSKKTISNVVFENTS